MTINRRLNMAVRRPIENNSSVGRIAIVKRERAKRKQQKNLTE